MSITGGLGPRRVPERWRWVKPQNAGQSCIQGALLKLFAFFLSNLSFPLENVGDETDGIHGSCFSSFPSVQVMLLMEEGNQQEGFYSSLPHQGLRSHQQGELAVGLHITSCHVRMHVLEPE